MSFLKYAVPALAVAKTAVAQCQAPDTTTIGSQATQLSACPTFSGSIAIATDAPPTVDFGGLGSIDGDLIVDTATQLQTFTANSVKNITGQFKMNNLTGLLNLEMQQLRGVGQIGKPNTGILWQGLPILQTFDFGQGLDSAASIDIENTQLQDLSPINVKVANMVQVSNNNQLSTLNWGTTNCTNLTISGNGATTNGINVTLASLQGVSSISIRNASALSLPNLEDCQGLLGVESGGIQRLDLPMLGQAGSVSVSNSPSLTEVSLPALEMCGGALKLINNDMLGGQISFPQLTQIRGELNITGAFTGVDIPKLNTIQGTSYLWSTQDISSTCSLFGPAGTGKYAGNKIQGKPIVCQGNHDSASAAGGSASKGGSGSGSSQSSGAAVANFIAQPASLFGASGLFAAMLGLM